MSPRFIVSVLPFSRSAAITVFSPAPGCRGFAEHAKTPARNIFIAETGKPW
jgi:hypothetical protein